MMCAECAASWASGLRGDPRRCVCDDMPRDTVISLTVDLVDPEKIVEELRSVFRSLEERTMQIVEETNTETGRTRYLIVDSPPDPQVLSTRLSGTWRTRRGAERALRRWRRRNAWTR